MRLRGCAVRGSRLRGYAVTRLRLRLWIGILAGWLARFQISQVVDERAESQQRQDREACTRAPGCDERGAVGSIDSGGGVHDEAVVSGLC